jgi:hypothetical protein
MSWYFVKIAVVAAAMPSCPASAIATRAMAS